MKSLPKVLAGIAAVVILFVVGLVANQSGAGAWPPPDFESSTAACVGGVRTTPASLTLINRETGFPGSPGHAKVLSVFPNFAYTLFDPAVVPNTGSASTTMTVTVPADFEGYVKIAWEFHWYGTDDSHYMDGKEEIWVEKCKPPVTTTTSTTSTSTSTTSTSTTSTTAPSTTTTSTTTPSTTSTSTTSTTHPTTTTSTTVPSTTSTSTTSTTRPETTTTSSTVPETTTTTEPSTTTTSTPCEDQTDDAEHVCLIPPVTVERPATPVPATPRFTG